MNKRAVKLISELDTYFLLYPIKQEATIEFERARDAVKGALRSITGSFLVEKTVASTEQDMIVDIINHCDDETQEELIHAFGEESTVAQLIRRNRIRCYGNSSKAYYPYDVLKENLNRELRDIRKSENPFYDGVIKYMERLGFEKDSDFYNSIGMPRQQFARLRDAKNALSKKTVLWIIVGLKLNYREAVDLLRKAGYSFRKGDLRDAMLSYIFRNVDYDLQTVNEVLDHFGAEPLC